MRNFVNLPKSPHKSHPQSILISRTDGIGDVVVTLPLAAYLKKQFPQCKIGFLCRSYTRAVVNQSPCVDEILLWDPDNTTLMIDSLQRYDTIIHVKPNKSLAFLAKKARIKHRIGTSHRWYHWLTCNKRVSFSRKKSNLHESELNFFLLKSTWDLMVPTRKEIIEQYMPLKPGAATACIEKKKPVVVVHPKSKGSSREWGIENFMKLMPLLLDNGYHVAITGVASEKTEIQPLLDAFPEVEDRVGAMDLDAFLEYLKAVDAFISASTGPLHCAAWFGKVAVGLFPPITPINPARWAPLGASAVFLVKGESHCKKCQKNELCRCIRTITPHDVLQVLRKGLTDEKK